MYKAPKMAVTQLNINTATEGEPIEVKIERIISNKEPIKDGAPNIYTPRGEGIRASTNIRTDRFEIAIEGMDKVAKSYKARREDKAKAEKPKVEGDSGAKPIQGNDGNPTE